MALNIIKSLKSNNKSIIASSQPFCKIMRSSYQSLTGQIHSLLVKRWKLVAELLDLPNEKSRRIVLRIKGLQQKSDTHVKRMATVFKEIRIAPEKLMEYPEILGYPPIQIEQRFFCLKELGLEPVSVPEILRYPTLMKRNAYDLKVMHLLPADVDPLDHLLSQLPFLNLNFLKNHPDIRFMSLNYIRKVVLLEFLAQKLECKKQEVLQLMKNYPVLSNRSIYSFLVTIDLLVNTLSFSIDKLKSRGYLLTIQPSEVEKLLSTFQDLKNGSNRDFIHQHPRFLLIPVDEILSAYEYIKQSELTGNFDISISTDVTKRHKMIYSYIQCLCGTKQKRQFQGFTSSSSKKSKTFSISNNLLYLALQFNKDPNCIRMILKRHPRLNPLQARNCRYIVNYLIAEGFSNLQIENALHLVLYSIDTIKNNLGALPRHKDIGEFGRDWKTHPYILQLMLYEIERNVLSTVTSDNLATLSRLY